MRFLRDCQLRPDVACFRRKILLSTFKSVGENKMRWAGVLYPHRYFTETCSKETHKKNDVTLDEIHNGWNCAFLNNPTRRWDPSHDQDGSNNLNSLWFLDLVVVEINRGIDEGDQDQDSTKVCILEIGLCFDEDEGLCWALKVTTHVKINSQ